MRAAGGRGGAPLPGLRVRGRGASRRCVGRSGPAPAGGEGAVGSAGGAGSGGSPRAGRRPAGRACGSGRRGRVSSRRREARQRPFYSPDFVPAVVRPQPAGSRRRRWLPADALGLAAEPASSPAPQVRGKGFPSFVLHCSSLFLGQRFLCSRVSGKSPAVSPAALVKWRLVSYQRDRGLIFRLFAVPVLVVNRQRAARGARILL